MKNLGTHLIVLGVFTVLIAGAVLLTTVAWQGRVAMLEARIVALESSQAKTCKDVTTLAEGWDEAYQTLDRKVDDIFEKLWVEIEKAYEKDEL